MDSTLKPHWRRNFSLFLTGQFISGITSVVVQYAIIWYLTMQTGSATILSLASIVGMVPMIVLSPLVGGLIDRSNKKAILIVTDAVVALFAILLSLAGTLSDTFPLWLVFISLFMRACAQTFQSPTIQSLLPTLVPEEELTRMNGRLSMIQSANFVIAPAVGAFLYSVVPIRELILLDVIGFVIGAGLLLFITIPDHRAETTEAIHPLKDATFGLQMLRSEHGLFIIILAEAVFTLLFMPASSMYPLMTTAYFHGTVAQAGIVEVAWSAGTIGGALIIGLVKNWRDRMRPMIVASYLIGILIGGSALLPSNKFGFFVFVGLNAIAGFSVPFYSTLLMAIIQQSFPPEKLGRVMGVVMSLSAISGPIGLIFAGPLGDLIGVENIFLIAGIGSIVSGLIIHLNSAARRYDLKLKQRLAQQKD